MRILRLFHGLKVVKSRATHICCACSEPIMVGNRTLVEFGKNKEEGYYSNYFHTNERECHLDYIDVMMSKPETIEKIKNPSFFGEIEYEHWKEKIYSNKELEEMYPELLN